MKPRGYFLFGSVIAVLGCVDGRPETGDTDDSVGEAQTGLSITGAVLATELELDVSHMQYKIKRVACAAKAEKAEKFEPVSHDIRVDMQPRLLLTGGRPAWEFSDHFQVLKPGCYDIAAQPLTTSGTASKLCTPASINDVRVIDGETTEVVLLSQCKGPEVGALDAVAAINQEPTLVNLTFSPSKFIKAGSSTEVCATAVDPNGDQIDFEWEELGGKLSGAVRSNQPTPEGVTECVTISPNAAGDYQFEVRIFDVIRTEAGGMIRIEKWLNEHGYPAASHDSLRFPVYAGTEMTEGPKVGQTPQIPGQSGQVPGQTGKKPGKPGKPGQQPGQPGEEPGQPGQRPKETSSKEL